MRHTWRELPEACDNTLLIAEMCDISFTEGEGRYLRREVFFGNYRRRLALPADVKPADVKADFENGVLTVQVPRAPKPQPVKVAVGAGSQA